MSRDDGMDEHGIQWLYGCPLAGFGLGSWPNNHHAAKFPHALTANLTPQHDSHSHGQDDGSKTIDYPYLDMSRDDGMDEHGIQWLYGCPYQAGFAGLGRVGLIIKLQISSCPDHKSDPQHDSHGPDDGTKTIDYPYLDMSRDDGMDEHGIETLYDECPLAGFGLGSLHNNHAAKFPHALTTNLTHSLTHTHMGKMMAPKPLIIII
jgi:hypothetical protein